MWRHGNIGCYLPGPHSGNTAPSQQAATSITGLSGREGVFVIRHPAKSGFANTGQGVSSVREFAVPCNWFGYVLHPSRDTSGHIPNASVGGHQDQ